MNSDMIKQFLEKLPPIKENKHPLNMKKNKEKKEEVAHGKRI